MSLGKRSTAQEALGSNRLDGRTALVTGANSGIGVETARVLALAGADVVMAVRSIDSGEKVRQQLEASLPKSSGQLTVSKLDLMDLESVRRFAKEFQQSGRPLDLLINNAGIMATPLGFTSLGYEQQMATNHLGHFLLTALLRPTLEKSSAARIVNVSSDAHRRGTGAGVLATLDTDRKYEQRKYTPFGAYGDSKLANILFARGLAKRLPPNVLAFSLHPGVIITNLTRSMGLGGIVFRFIGRAFTKSVEQGAATTIYGATSPDLVTRSGVYLSDCAESVPIPDGTDAALADKVWTLSERIVGL